MWMRWYLQTWLVHRAINYKIILFPQVSLNGGLSILTLTVKFPNDMTKLEKNRINTDSPSVQPLRAAVSSYQSYRIGTPCRQNLEVWLQPTHFPKEDITSLKPMRKCQCLWSFGKGTSSHEDNVSSWWWCGEASNPRPSWKMVWPLRWPMWQFLKKLGRGLSPASSLTPRKIHEETETCTAVYISVHTTILHSGQTWK